MNWTAVVYGALGGMIVISIFYVIVIIIDRWKRG